MKQWSLTTLRDKLIKIGAKVVHHARYVTFQLAEVAVPRRLYRAILERIRRFATLPQRGSLSISLHYARLLLTDISHLTFAGLHRRAFRARV